MEKLLPKNIRRENKILFFAFCVSIILFFLIEEFSPQMHKIIESVPLIGWLSFFIPSKEGLLLDVISFIVSSIPTLIVIYKQYLEDLF